MTDAPQSGKSEIPTDAEANLPAQNIGLRGRRITLQLRVIFAMAFLALILLQIAAVDVFMWRFAENRAWDLQPEVIIAFLSATVVEVLGVVTIIVKYLFDDPGSDERLIKSVGD